jgi:hypothetical protein
VYSRRQLRLRVLEALEQRVKQFAIREELWPLRVPHEPLPLGDLVDQVLGDEASSFDMPGLRSRTLLSLEWEDGSRWDVWVIVLPSRLKLFCDTSDDESRILASGGRNEGDESDRIFLELLAESAGEHFGIEMAGGPPSRVRTSLTDRSFVVDLFLGLFEVSGLEEEIRRALIERVDDTGVGSRGRDFREDVEAWLDRVSQPANRQPRT